MNISMEDSAAVKRSLAAIGRQAPFALSLGLNNLGLEAQQKARGEIHRTFNLRGTGKFFDRGVIFKRGNKRNPTATLSIGADGPFPASGTKRATAILARHEQASQRQSTEVVRAGNKLVPAGFFIPGPGMRSASKGVPRKLYPAAIGATIRLDGTQLSKITGYYASRVKSKGRGWRNVRDEFFVIPRVGIFQRQSGGLGSKVRPIWFFARTIRTPARTRFAETAGDVVDGRFVFHIDAAIARALETAR